MADIPPPTATPQQPPLRTSTGPPRGLAPQAPPSPSSPLATRGGSSWGAATPGGGAARPPPSAAPRPPAARAPAPCPPSPTPSPSPSPSPAPIPTSPSANSTSGAAVSTPPSADSYYGGGNYNPYEEDSQSQVMALNESSGLPPPPQLPGVVVDIPPPAFTSAVIPPPIPTPGTEPVQIPPPVVHIDTLSLPNLGVCGVQIVLPSSITAPTITTPPVIIPPPPPTNAAPPPPSNIAPPPPSSSSIITPPSPVNSVTSIAPLIQAPAVIPSFQPILPPPSLDIPPPSFDIPPPTPLSTPVIQQTTTVTPISVSPITAPSTESQLTSSVSVSKPPIIPATPVDISWLPDLTSENRANLWTESWKYVFSKIMLMHGFNKLNTDFFVDQASTKIRPKFVTDKFYPAIITACEQFVASPNEASLAEAQRQLVDLIFKCLGFQNIQSQYLKEKIKERMPHTPPAPSPLTTAAGDIIKSCREFMKFARSYRLLVKAQARVRGWLARRYYKSLLPRYIKGRSEAFKQLLRTERVLVGKLDCLSESFLKPLQEQRDQALASNGTQQPIMTEDEITMLFGEARPLFVLHKAIYQNLEKILDFWPAVDGLGILFTSIASRFRIYSSFVKHSAVHADTLERLERENTAFVDFIKQKTASMKAPPLRDLLSCPIQQIKQYDQVLQCMVENTPPSHPEAASLTEALSYIGKTNQVVQQALGLAEQKRVIYAAINKLGGYSEIAKFMKADDERIFLWDGEVSFFLKKKSKTRHMFMFSDKLLFTEKKNKKVEKYIVKESFNLNEIKSVKDSLSEAKPAETKLGVDLVFGTATVGVKPLAPSDKPILLSQANYVYDKYNHVYKVFGTSLEELLKSEGRQPTDVPEIVQSSCKFLLNYLDIVGIFRLSGRQSDVTAVRKFIESVPAGQPITFTEAQDPICIAVALKFYFRELKIPLLSFKLYQEFTQITKIDVEETFVNSVAPLLAQLPEQHKATLKYLMVFLNKVSAKSEVNKMDNKNLSIVFAPNFLRPAVETVETVLQIPDINAVVTGMLNFSTKLLSMAW
ncbi:Rho-type GTPase-activating protein 1/2 [Pelomyxa schiedti]|nr:Rho-type GTPase-activating protein 1/2 [Pelomyxa schiedti]